jgi:anthranilate synthase component I
MSMSEAFLENLPLVRANGDASRFLIRGVEVGGANPVMIAGPCAVESVDQILEIAKAVKAEGAQGLRGGVFKPRSSPYSFQGLGEVGLEYLAAAREKVGLFTVVEVTSSEQIAQVMDFVDVIQIGARNMQNFELLKAVGRIQKPILLKRGLSATIQELLQAAEYILYEGNLEVILCERGIRTFETMTRNTLDINAIPLLKQLTHLPVFADPSHGTGRSDLVIPVSKAALSAGANGLIVEVHPTPDTALSDGKQSLNFHEFADLMKELKLPKKRMIPQIKSQILPTFEKFAEIFTNKDYQYIPIQAEFITDSETPVTVFTKLSEGTGRFLLESVERGEQVGRYSFIGWNPLVTFKASGNRSEILYEDSTTLVNDRDPLTVLNQTLDSLKVAPTIRQEKFFGGAVGYIGYDYVRQIEKIPCTNQAALQTPDLYWIIPKYLTTFDHVSHKITIIVLAKVDRSRMAETYQNAVHELETIVNKFHNPIDLQPLSDFQESKKVTECCSLSKEQYMKRVEQIKKYINAGDAFQVVLSQRIEQPFDGDPLLFYRLLRTINPSPYLFYLDFGEFQLAGSSPEVMVRKEEQIVTLKPIAGTRPRGISAAEDQLLRKELITDEKERAEHTMLVDLGRNDLGRVCKFGTVAVTDLMNIENYSHVMHIVSTIQGELMPSYSGVDLLRAVFPAGTLSGAPKVRAMEIIEEMEPIERGFYGGTVGYLGFNGNLDTCITIRTVLFKDQQAVCQVGAGIVADSIPENEYQETMNKAGALLTALAKVGGGAC